MNRRVLLTGLFVVALVAVVAVVVIAFINLAGSPGRSVSTGRNDDPNSPRDHLTVRYEADGHVYFGTAKSPVATLRDARQSEPLVWDDALTRYKQAVLARFDRRGFGPGGFRKGAVLTIVAPADTPWRIVTWLMYPTGDPALRIPTIRLMPVGRDPLTLPLPQDPDYTDAYVMDPPHIHVDEDGIALYDGGVFAEVGYVSVDPDASPTARFRTPSVGSGDLGDLREAVRAALIKSEAWAGGRAVLTWPTECSVPLDRMTDILTRIMKAGPTILYLGALEPDEIHGR